MYKVAHPKWDQLNLIINTDCKSYFLFSEFRHPTAKDDSGNKILNFPIILIPENQGEAHCKRKWSWTKKAIYKRSTMITKYTWLMTNFTTEPLDLIVLTGPISIVGLHKFTLINTFAQTLHCCYCNHFLSFNYYFKWFYLQSKGWNLFKLSDNGWHWFLPTE